LFRRTGTLHLFAVSGLNVAMLGVVVWYVLRPFGIRRSRAVLIIIPVLAFYAVITGLGASCVRAAIMASIVLLGETFERPPVVFNSLAAAALAILAWDTNELYSSGFQFSFVLVAVIVLGAARLQRKMEPFGQPDPFLPRPLWTLQQRWTANGWRLVAGAFAVTIAAWLGSLLFTAGYFPPLLCVGHRGESPRRAARVFRAHARPAHASRRPRREGARDDLLERELGVCKGAALLR
jgi:ComEC/Rec2-related protein